MLFRSWGLEELACVHEYLIKEMEYSLGELEGIFVEDIKEAAKYDEEVLPNPSPSHTGYPGESRYSELCHLECYGFGIFDRLADQGGQIEMHGHVRSSFPQTIFGTGHQGTNDPDDFPLP